MVKTTLDEEKRYYALNKRAFDALAPFYDVMVYPVSRIRDRVVEVTDAPTGSKILDVATGTGKQAMAFAKRGYDVIGIDISDAMLAVAARKNKYSNAVFRHEDATRLPFSDKIFDVSSISFGLHDMPAGIRGKALQEMVRVTKSDGSFIIVDYALPESAIGKYVIYHFVRIYERGFYSEFIHSDLDTLLEKTGITVCMKRPAIWGAVRILKGVKAV